MEEAQPRGAILPPRRRRVARDVDLPAAKSAISRNTRYTSRSLPMSVPPSPPSFLCGKNRTATALLPGCSSPSVTSSLCLPSRENTFANWILPLYMTVLALIVAFPLTLHRLRRHVPLRHWA